MKLFILLVAYACIACFQKANADYALGCSDPEYEQYIEQRLTFLETRNRRLLADTLRDYEMSLTTSSNLYRVIASLSRHLKYSAQFDPIDTVSVKIDRIFEHAEQMTIDQQIAGDVYDGFSSETHSVGIARAWIAYRQGKHELAFEELLMSIDIKGSALLGSFGPDVELIRLMYLDGHVKPVIDYIRKTESFWTGKRADELRSAWLKMIEAKCKIQFDPVDTIKIEELGMGTIDLKKTLGIEP